MPPTFDWWFLINYRQINKYLLPLLFKNKANFVKMPLTERQNEYLGVLAELMGQNGGLYYQGLTVDPRVFRVAGNSRHAPTYLNSTIRRIGKSYGMNNSGIGEIAHEAAARGDTDMPIVIPSNTKPQLTPLEQLVLESVARVQLPKGGCFDGYKNEVCELLEIDSMPRLDNALIKIVQKFNADNIEQAMVTALVAGILDPDELFGSELPQSLKNIMSSEAYRKAVYTTSTSVYARIGVHLRSDEEKIASEFIKQMGINGGLFWIGWIRDIANKTGKGYNSGLMHMENLRRKFGVHNNGKMLYLASRRIGEPVIAYLPHRAEVNFSEREYGVMLEIARFLLPQGGYYDGFLKDVAKFTYYNPLSVGYIAHGVIEKTGTANLGQAVAYFIAHELIPINSLHLDPRRIPALEAIITAMRDQRYLPERPYLQLQPATAAI